MVCTVTVERAEAEATKRTGTQERNGTATIETAEKEAIQTKGPQRGAVRRQKKAEAEAIHITESQRGVVRGHYLERAEPGAIQVTGTQREDGTATIKKASAEPK